MKHKKIMLVALILLAVLTISAVSASDDIASDGNLTVSEEEDSIDTSTDDVELLSQGDDGNVGADVSFDVEVADEVDLADENAAIVNVTCPENAQGYIAVVVSGEDENEDCFEFDPVYHQI